MPKGPRPPLTDAAENDYAARARNISSVSRTMSDIDKRSQKAANSLSSDVSSLSRKQKSIEDRLRDVESYSPAEKDMKATSSTILRNVNLALITLASGMKKITTGTASALKDAVGDYGRAISEDFSINKQNMTAMALSKISPVFGYFVSKFMQTDVYRRAIDKIKDSMSSALSAIGGKIKGWFHGGGKSPDEAIDKLTKKMPKRPKKMQVGGYVTRGGLAQVHAAEVIMPIDKVMDRMNSGTEIQQSMLTALEDLNIHMRTFSDSYRKDIMHRKGLVGDFIRSLISGEYGRSWEMQMLFLQKEIRNAIVDQSKSAAQRMNEAMEITMRRHPTFRAIMRFTNWTTKFGKFLMWTFPIKNPYRALKWAFGKRDKYVAALGKATAAPSVLLRVENILALIYTSLAPSLDRMNASLYSIGANIFNLTEKALGAGKGEMPKYDVPTWRRIGSLGRGIAAPFRLGARAYRAARGAITEGLTEKVGKLKAAEELGLTTTSTDMEEVDGVFYPKKEAAKIRSKKEKQKTSPLYQMKELIKIRKASEKTADNTSTMMSRLKKFGSDILFYLGLAWNMISSVLSMIPGMGSIMRGISSLGGLAASAGKGIFSAGKFLLTRMIMPIISSLGSWITGLLSSVGLTGLAGTLGTSLTGLAGGGIAGIGSIVIGTIAAGLIGYGIGWVVNKGIDWLFGEEGGLGSWVYDKLNPVIEDKRVSLIDQAWSQMKVWGEMVVEYVVWPFKAMYELAKNGVSWIWDQVKKVPGISTILEWGSQAYQGAKNWLTAPTGETDFFPAFMPSRADQAKEYLLGKKQSLFEDATWHYRKGMRDLEFLYETSQDPRIRKHVYERMVALRDEFAAKSSAKIQELKAKGIDITKEQKAELEAELAKHENLVNQIRDSVNSVKDSVKEGAKNVASSVSNSVSTVINNNNNNNMGPSESRFLSFGSGDRMAARVLECNPIS